MTQSSVGEGHGGLISLEPLGHTPTTHLCAYGELIVEGSGGDELTSPLQE